jgi:UDP-glucose 4-epimerase
MNSIYNGANVMVTGGAGFIGSNLAKELVKLGANVTVADDMFTGNKDNLKGVEIINMLYADVRKMHNHSHILLDQDYVFHLAARNIILSTTNPIEDYEVNIGGTLRMLLLLKESTRLKKFIYASSASVYGNHKHLPANEDDGINILSPYAASKLGGENYTKVFYEQYKLPVSVVRYSNVFGVNQRIENPYCGVISRVIHSILNNEQPVVYGNGEQTRDFTYVEDAVSATLLAASSDRANGEIFNVGSGTETSINALTVLVNKLTNNSIPTNYMENRDIDNIRRRVMNIDKIKNLLNWEPKYTLSQGLIKTINWLQNSDGK